MISAGNDVVSLAAINVTRTNQHKFYSKILSDAEIPLYNEFSFAKIPFEIFVWLLWSVKESAYKFLQRSQPELLFTPVRFVVTDIFIPEDVLSGAFNPPVTEGKGFGDMACIKSTLKFAENTLHSCSVLFNDLIHTVINQTIDFGDVSWGVKKIGTDDDITQSAEARSFLLNRLNALNGESKFAISKNMHGIPVLLRDEAETGIPASLSHHGHFVGYSFYKSGN